MNNLEQKIGFFDLRNPSRIEVVTAVADTEVAITHNLGRVPSGYIVLKQDKAGSLYESGTAWTDKIAYFKSNGTTVTFVVTFI